LANTSWNLTLCSMDPPPSHKTCETFLCSGNWLWNRGKSSSCGSDWIAFYCYPSAEKFLVGM
jgi:hypothetical protein